MKGSENLTDPSGYVWERRLKNQWRLKRSDGRADYFFFFFCMCMIQNSCLVGVLAQ